ncbi:MAG: hypothetical protein ACRCWJ_15160 [Casimicrobium sp.]
MKWLDPLRKLARPAMTWSIFMMVLPFTIGIGVAEAIHPGGGVRFADGALHWLQGLPEEFWAFAFGVFGVVSIGRSFGNDKKVEAAEALVKAKEIVNEQREEGDYVPHQ